MDLHEVISCTAQLIGSQKLLENWGIDKYYIQASWKQIELLVK